MAPISAIVTPIEVRLTTRLEIRQTAQPVVVTLTETREFTTYTSTITLGTDTVFPAAPTNAPTTTSAPITVQTVAPAPAKSSPDNNGVVIGSVLGTFLGLAVLLAIVWKCCYDGRSVLWQGRGGYDDDSSYGSDSLGSSRSSRREVRRRGGDLDGLKRPRKARTRYRREDGSYDGEYEEWRDEKRSRTGPVVRDGMLGWTFAPVRGGKRKSSSRRRDSWVESETVRMRFTVDD